jgi:hypothetical protein
LKKNKGQNAMIISLCLLLTVATFYVAMLPVPRNAPIDWQDSSTIGTTYSTSLGSVNNLAAATLAQASYCVSIDVNPSIELKVTEGLVTEALAFNDDGQSVLLEINVIGLAADEAVKTIVTALIEAGYISESEIEPALIVTVTNGGQAVGEEAAEALEKAAEEILESQAVECKVRTAYIPDEVAAAAASCGLTTGRYIILDYAAQTEGITIEEAITKYGSLKIGEMLDLFEGVKDVFKTYNQTAEGDEDGSADLEGMTPEQQALFQAALAAYHTEIKAANDAFHTAFATIKADFKLKIADIRIQYRHVDKTLYHQSMNQLREEMLAARREAITVMKAAFKTAQANFKAAMAAIGLPEDTVDEELEEIADSEGDTDEGLNDLLGEFVQEPDDSDEDAPAMTQPDNQDKGNSNNNQGKGQGKKING